MDSTRDPVGFHHGPQPLEVDGSVGPDLIDHQRTAFEERGIRGGEQVSPDELLDFLDSLSSSPSSSTTQITTGPSSTPLSVQSTPLFGFDQTRLFPEIDPASSSSSSSLGFLFDSIQIQNTLNDKQVQVKPQHSSTSSFTMNGKGFDAGDISMPFDLSLPLFDTIAYPVLPQEQPSHLPTVSLGAGVDPVALDSSLDSPLDASPWSDLLASPMFSLPNSGTVSETPLPTLERHSSSSSFVNEESIVSSSFPPLPLSSTPYEPSTTTLRPLPPLPIHPSSHSSRPDLPVLPTPPPRLLPSSRSVSSETSSSSSSSSITTTSKVRSEPTGFRTTIPLLGPDAPIQTRAAPILPSATSRKRKTAGAEKALAAKKQKQQRSAAGHKPQLADEDGGGRQVSPVALLPTPTPLSNSNPVNGGEEGGGGRGEEEELPAEIVAQMERKRLQNTMSARKSRARKQLRMQELEQENQSLVQENERLKQRLMSLGLTF